MKKSVFLIVSVLFVLISLENCKRDPQINKTITSDADSLYQGTPYTLTKPSGFPTIRHPYKDSLTVEGIELGRRLFYDVHLSVNGDKSCGSCHKTQFALSDSGAALSINEFGPTKRNAPAIENLLWSSSLFWDGRQPTLADQAADAYQHELGLVAPSAIAYLQHDSTYVGLFRKAFGRPGDITANKIYLAVQEFMMTAISANSKFDRVQRGLDQFTESEARGFNEIFVTEKGECFHCHSDGFSRLMTDNLFHNNGINPDPTVNTYADQGRGAITGNSNDNGKFRSPSLRNIAVTGPYMHDGRYKTLEQVINFYSDSLNSSPNMESFMLIHDTAGLGFGLHFNDQQKQDILNFLNTLTDDQFLNDPKLKNPF